MVISQKRPQLERFWMQVDRQTKSSFASKAEAEKAGAAIKKAFPKVQVSVYDSEQSSNTILGKPEGAGGYAQVLL